MFPYNNVKTYPEICEMMGWPVVSGRQKQLQLAKLAGWRKVGRSFIPDPDAAPSEGRRMRSDAKFQAPLLVMLSYYLDKGPEARTTGQWLKLLGVPDTERARAVFSRTTKALARRGDISAELEYIITENDWSVRAAFDDEAEIIAARFNPRRWFAAQPEERARIASENARFFMDEYGWRRVVRVTRIEMSGEPERPGLNEMREARERFIAALTA